MNPNPASKRDRLIDSAAELFHRKGMPATSLADIAKHADIPIGNVYYYFKTKEELALAALNKRKARWSNAYGELDQKLADPRERLIQAVQAFLEMGDEFARFGCPIGKTIQDAEPERDAVAKAATSVFEHFVAWATSQFEKLGHETQAREYAIHLIGGIEGAAVLAKAFADPKIVQAEIARLIAWLQSIPNKKIQLGKAGIRVL